MQKEELKRITTNELTKLIGDAEQITNKLVEMLDNRMIEAHECDIALDRIDSLQDDIRNIIDGLR